MAHLIPLTKLPSAKETTNLLLHHIFRLHGLPADIVSDRGPQFKAQFWKKFCHLLGITVSLSSIFYPQWLFRKAKPEIRDRSPPCSRDPSSWADNNVCVEYADNSLPTSATGLSPFRLSTVISHLCLLSRRRSHRSPRPGRRSVVVIQPATHSGPCIQGRPEGVALDC